MNRKNNKSERNAKSSYWHFSSLNFILMIIGICLLVLGFVLLYLVDSLAENTFSMIAPLLIICAYICVFIALLVEKHE